MKEFRVIFTTHHGVNIEASTKEEAEEIVKSRDWEYGMDWSEGDVEIDEITEY
jgi:hypothetical protein